MICITNPDSEEVELTDRLRMRKASEGEMGGRGSGISG
jgi:hypothetical protein